jgi:HEAT repeat protein
VNSTSVHLNPPRPIRLPDDTRALVLQRFSESQANLRENAVRIIASMAGGVPPFSAPRLLQMARTDSEGKIRRAAIEALASITSPASEITDFWLDGLKDVSNVELRGAILHAFRFYAPTDSRVISLVIDALKDTDYYVRQEAIAAVIKIGKPASGALVLLNTIRDTSANADERDQAMRLNAEAAIRILSKE